MILGFEDITAILTEEEKLLVKPMVNGFSRRWGKENAITSKEIIEAMYAAYNVKLTGAKVRKYINYIRHHHLPNLVATSNGYYLTNDYKELREYLESLDGRESAIRAVKLNLKKYIEKITKGQQTQLGL